ncbi:hypothetical protein, partial [uncultured Helicobacter sp.]|uniref:beta strand repeat-containing protein n=1 Tax=uncultured Helicobacter sp. TaxID=175537 RepID=UPI002603CEE4
NGLRAGAGTGNDNANIVGAGSKNITFNFTGNTKKDKYVGAVVGDATKVNTVSGSQPSTLTAVSTTDSDTATYTMLNLKKYTANDQIDGDGSLKVTSSVRGEDKQGGKTLIDAIQEAGLTNFNNPSGNDLGNHYGTATRQKDSETNIEKFSTTKTTLSLRGTSLDATNISFQNYIYDFAFGSGLGEIEGVTIQDSKLKGTIDLSTNTNTGHKIVMRGDSIEGGSAEIKFKAGNFGSSSGGVFVYDDYTATRSASSTPTLKLSGLSQTNYLTTGSALNISNTNLEGDIWASNNTAINLNFTDGNTWKMDESGMRLASGSNLVINGKIEKLTTAGRQSGTNTPPVLKLQFNGAKAGNIQLINTGAVLNIDSYYGSAGGALAKTLDLRGTSLDKFRYQTNNGNLSLHGTLDSGKVMTMTFASGSNIETIVKKDSSDSSNGNFAKITDKEADTGYLNGTKLTHTGSYNNGVYDGNYIADSYGKFGRIVTNSTVNVTFIGDASKQRANANGNGAWSQYDNSRYGNNSKLTLINVKEKINGGNSSTLEAKEIGGFIGRDNISSTITVTLQGTSLKDGANILKSNSDGSVKNQNRVTFDMTFIKNNTTTQTTDASTTSTYVDQKYGEDLALTNANGALSDSILKVAESSLEDGLDFGSANFNVLFVGDASQTLDGNGNNGTAKVFKGGSASSIVTFRDSNLNAGNSTASSLQNIKGTIAFDLSHDNEDMSISGTLSNMFGSDSGQTTYNGTGKYQTKFGDARGDQADGLVIDKLVFVKVGSNSGESGQANTLTSLKTNGNYFNDTDTFGSLASNDYSTIGYIKDLDDNKNSSLTFGEGTIALKGANQEIIFIGSKSHGFGNTASASTLSTQAGESSATTTNNGVSKLGDSTGSTLTFIDAGELKVANIQNGKGTINLIGSTRIELQDISTGAGARNSTKTLTLYKAGTTTTAPSTSALTDPSPITGQGITINAVFTGSNVLGDGVNIKTSSNGDANDVNGKKASNVNIGQAGEQTTYHILFDYTDALGDKTNKGFGEYWTYQGNITGLTSDSIIKFKNAGYITGDQIANTSATILLDNTELKADFRGDNAILDFTNGRSSIAGNILTSDTKSGQSGNVLSRKTLTFDLTNNTDKKLAYNHNIQAGYKIAPNYNTTGQSILTFQNAPTMSLGDDNNTAGARGTNTNPSDFIQSLAKDVGFSGIANAKTEEPTASAPAGTIALATAQTIDQNTSYILKGTKLVFQGTSITAGSSKAITEDTYELDLSFDNRDEGRGSTGLGETLGKSTLTANSITMKEITTTGGKKPLGLSLSFKDSGSLVGESKTITANNGSTTVDNVLNVKLKNDARFNFSAVSDNGLIGTLILSQNGTTQAGGGNVSQQSQEQTRNSLTALNNVSTNSTLSIAEGSMSFIGKFSQKDSTTASGGASSASSTTAGAINATFNGTNKIYGTLAGRGEMNVTINGEGVFSKDSMSSYNFAKPTNFGDVDVLLDASNATSGTITLSHTSGKVGVKGKTYVNSTSSSGGNAQSNFTAINLSNYVGNDNNSLTLQGAFDLGSASLNFSGKQFVVTDNLFLKSNSGNSITLKDIKIKNDTPSNLVTQNTSVQKTLSIGAIGGTTKFALNLTLTNLDPNLIVELTNTSRSASIQDWGNSGIWNIRGTNIQLTTAFWAENNTNLKKFVFAKGNGTEVTKDPASQTQTQDASPLTLDKLTGDDKINQSALSGSVTTATGGDSNDSQNVRNVIMKNGEMTFIGKQSLAISEANQKFDGTQGKITFGLYNTILKSGSVLLDNTNNGDHSNLGKNANIQDVATLRGTDTFNLSVGKASSLGTIGANNSTINAVFINGTNNGTNNGATQATQADTSITGVKYIDATQGDEALKTTLSQYATTNAGGALSDSILKTLQ